MTTTPALQTPATQRAMFLGLAVLVTAGVLGSVQSLAGADHAAQLAQRQPAQHAVLAAL